MARFDIHINPGQKHLKGQACLSGLDNVGQ